jgi:protein involved in polysaccharide export with SLBB domain
MLEMRIPVLIVGKSQVAHLSEAFTLEPGDAVRVEVDRIGSLTTDAATACALSVLS